MIPLRTARPVVLAPALLALAVLTGCGGDDGPATSTPRSIAAVDAIDAKGALRVVVVRGERPSVRVQGGKDLVDRVAVDVEDGTLRLDGEGDSGILGLGEGTRATVTVTVPRLRSAHVGGAVDLRLEDVDGDALKVRASGGSDVEGSGRVGRLQATVSGGGDLDLGELIAQDVELRVSGGGDATVHASRTLDARVSGGGDATYAGDPQVTKHLSGGADLHRE